MVLKGKIIIFSKENERIFKNSNDKLLVSSIGEEDSRIFLYCSDIFGYGFEEEDLSLFKKNNIIGVLSSAFAPLIFRKLVNYGLYPIKVEKLLSEVKEVDIKISFEERKVFSSEGFPIFSIEPPDLRLINIIRKGGLLKTI